MIINYKINSDNHNIIITDKIKDNIISQVERVKSDKKILLAYDEKIDKSIINLIREELKLIGAKIVLVRISGKKRNKNSKILFKIIDILIANQFTKNSIFISCGGGVVGDLSNLTASLYLRGMIYFHIPSTMTAIIDSCIGGKTAINYKDIINSVGTYYHPKSVMIFKDIIDRLPDREYYAGIPEIIKCGLIKKSNILKNLIKHRDDIKKRKFKILKQIISETLETKIFFFKNDIYEKNLRLNLNFGHTFAHAMEMATDKSFKKDYLRHGEAVGIGIMCEIFYANGGPSKLLKEVINILESYNLPTKLLPLNFTLDIIDIQNKIYEGVFLDKKKINKNPRYICLKKKNNPQIKEIKDLDLLNYTIKYFLN